MEAGDDVEVPEADVDASSDGDGGITVLSGGKVALFSCGQTVRRGSEQPTH